MGLFIRLYMSAPSAGLVDADAVSAVIGGAVMQPHSVFVSHDQGFPVLGANKPDKGSFPTYLCSSVNSFVGCDSRISLANSAFGPAGNRWNESWSRPRHASPQNRPIPTEKGLN